MIIKPPGKPFALHRYYAGGSQTAQILPLVLNIPPTESVTASTVAQLVKNLGSRGNTTTAGIVGTAFLLQVRENEYSVMHIGGFEGGQISLDCVIVVFIEVIAYIIRT